VLVHAKPAAANPRKVGISELFTVDPDAERAWFPANTLLQKAFLGLDRVTRPLDRLVPGRVRRRSIARAERWVLERLNGENGLGAIFPAMVNAYEMLRLLGYGAQHPLVRQCRTALRRLLVDRGDEAYCQPCVSPVWDTALACLALQACPGDPDNRRSLRRALHWLTQRQLDREPGDWRDAHPDLLGGGWAFQFANPHYPDLDDTAAVAWALWQSHPDGAAAAADERIHRAADWLCGMQSRNGGFAAFDSDNTSDYLNAIPFADHGALLDPPTSDVTARCVALLSRLNRARDREVLERALRFLGREQEQDGGWYGRWGTNYIYGTWSVLSALETVPKAPDTIRIGDAVAWLKRRQGADGGWGESNDSYLDPARGEQPGTPFQTAWAMLALMAAGEPDGPALRAGAQFLLRRQRADGSWSDGYFTAPGFPRVFYLRYHGYNAYFPLWALARYERLLGRSGAAEGA
jgi:squalene-hopene/tetraprenyl-beta-curcumene cyclase